MRIRHLPFILFLAFSCNSSDTVTEVNIPNAVDIHSHANAQVAVTPHLHLDLVVDFDQQQLIGNATYDLAVDSLASHITFDVNQISIDSVLILEGGDRIKAEYEIGEHRPFVGAPLNVKLKGNPEKVTIYYKSDPQASALLWLKPEQTHGKKKPFLFTQGQAVLTRTWIPVQDSPGIRFTYSADIQVPRGLMALMSATNPQELNEEGTYHFNMDRPIPAYLMALAVGDIAFGAISDRSGVYAEPGMLDASTYEMADLEKMIQTAEDLYGPYQWNRYDLIVLPPSFPFGGMENPKLTFATPTIIAGDRSLTSLIAHELAHSWSGNLVTNATWEDFWLNEGHTVYIERRIMEQLYGKEYADMLALLGFQDLKKTIEDLGPSSADTKLKLSLADRDPDDGMNDVAYEKGYLLLRTIEELAGRENFDRYLKTYFDHFAFESISTEQWEAYVRKHLIDSLGLDIELASWLYMPGLPENHSMISSNKFGLVDDRAKQFVRLGRLDRSNTRNWSTHEWLHFIRQIPTDLHISFYEKLDDVFELSNSGNSEILAAWFDLSIRSNYLHNHNEDKLEDFLINVGRRKFLMPLYRALRETNELELAKSIFEKAKNNYHSVASNSISALLYDETPAI